MIPSVSAARARSARIAVSTLFFASGVLVSSFLPRLPEIRDGLGLTNAELGAAIAALPIGGLLAGGFAGVLIARFGSGRVGAVAGVAAALAVVAIGLAPSWPALAFAFLVLGVFDSVDGRVAELARRRRAARVRPVDPAGAPRDVGRRRARGGRRSAPSPHPPASPSRRTSAPWGSSSRSAVVVVSRTIPAAGGRRRAAAPRMPMPRRSGCGHCPGCCGSSRPSPCSGSCASSCRAPPRPGARSTSPTTSASPRAWRPRRSSATWPRWCSAGSPTTAGSTAGARRGSS